MKERRKLKRSRTIPNNIAPIVVEIDYPIVMVLELIAISTYSLDSTCSSISKKMADNFPTLVQKAIDLFDNERLLEAYHLLIDNEINVVRTVDDESSNNKSVLPSDITQKLQQIIQDGKLAEQVMREFNSDDGWKLCVEKDKMQSFYKDNGRGMHAVKVQGYISAPIFQVLSIFYEGSFFRENMDLIVESNYYYAIITIIWLNIVTMSLFRF